MAILERVKNILVEEINSAFRTIGTGAPTRPPKVKKSNTGVIAWEYFIAKHLYTMASARRKRATEEAIAAGVIFDHEREPHDVTTGEQIYQDECVTIMLTVSNSAPRVNPEKLVKYLEGKVPEKVLKEAVDKATFYTRPAHEFKAMIRTQ